jgi:putative hydrolase of the HAD superfamily
MIPWRNIDTVLLDMDGTLLDLCFDTILWTQVLPARYAKETCQSLGLAEKYLFDHMKEIRTELNFYCLEYWAEFTGLDILALHRELAHLITYRQDALAFLKWLAGTHHKAYVVTNAHRTGLEIKTKVLKFVHHLDGVISSHDYQQPKESQLFWDKLEGELQYNKATTLFIDDNVDVLSAAKTHGIQHLLCITQPDSLLPHRKSLPFPAFNTFAEICELE